MTDHTERRQDKTPLWPRRLREAASRIDMEGKAHKAIVARHMRELAAEISEIIATGKLDNVRTKGEDAS